MRSIFRLLFTCCLLTEASFGALAQGGYSFNRSMARAEYLNWLAYRRTKDEGGNLKKWWRSESTIGLSMSGPLNYSQHCLNEGTSGVAPFDTVITGVAKSYISYAVNSNVNGLLFRVSSNSMISYSYGFDLTYLRYKIPTNDLSQPPGDDLSDIDVFRFGVPVTIDYKMGCDVDFDSEQPFCFAVGAGILPYVQMNLLRLTVSDGTPFSVKPFIYADFGLYVLGCWKIRVSYTPGPVAIFNNQNLGFGADESTITASTANVITIGISHMKYSGDWRNARGWRTGRGEGGGGSVRHNMTNSLRLF